MDLKLKTTMKKIFVTLATIGLLATTSVYAADGGKKTERAVSVSYTVEAQFESAFSDAKDVTWSVTPNVQKAAFTLNDVKMTAFYSLQGEYMGTTQNVDYSTINPKAKAEIADKYKGYSVSEVIKLQTNASEADFDETVYFVDLKNQTGEILLRVTPNAGVYFFKTVK